MPLAIGRTLGYARIALPGNGLCVIYVSAKKPASDRDWAEYIEWLQKTRKPGEPFKSLVMDQAGGPNAAQRKQLNDVTAPCSLSVAVLSPSAVGRGVVTAMNWFKKDSYKAFLPTELDEAIASLDITGAAAAETRKAVLEMMRTLDV